jgi:uncharacterized protein YfaT (DUF1175 family)
MNAKLCKKLRRAARAETVGRPDKSWVQHRGIVNNGVIENHPLSTRGFYRRLKKEIKRGGLRGMDNSGPNMESKRAL